MHKNEFLTLLRQRLSALPEEDVNRTIDYYSEIIEDHMEDGLAEEEAVAAVGSMEEIVSQILPEAAPPRLPEAAAEPPKAANPQPVPRRGWKLWEVILLILGAPLWLPLLIAVVSVLFAFYIVLWSLVLALYAVMLSFGVCGLVSIFGIALIGMPIPGAFSVGVGLCFLGITILAFFVCNAVAKGIWLVTKATGRGILRLFRKGV